MISECFRFSNECIVCFVNDFYVLERMLNVESINQAFCK